VLELVERGKQFTITARYRRSGKNTGVVERREKGRDKGRKGRGEE